MQYLNLLNVRFINNSVEYALLEEIVEDLKILKSEDFLTEQIKKHSGDYSGFNISAACMNSIKIESYEPRKYTVFLAQPLPDNLRHWAIKATQDDIKEYRNKLKDKQK